MKIVSVLSISLLLATACTLSPKQEVNVPYSGKGKSVTVFTTSMGTEDRLSSKSELSFREREQPLERNISVFVNPNRTFQTLLGIGGAITDASAEVYAKLPIQKQNEFLRAYFGPEGINYSIIRTNIHSCDFSSESYTYIQEGDEDLKSFSIAHDLKYRIPMIKQAFKLADNKISFFASPWSPPAFMKDNNHMLSGGKLLPKYHQTWANYFVKFIKSYEVEGIPVWGLTVQNEPMAVQRWESCIFTAEEERDFLKNYLGPTLEKEGLGDKKIIVWDHNRDLISDRANVIFDDPVASKYAWGIGYHWYETWSGGDSKFDNIANVQESYPSKNLLFTEGCVEKFNADNYQQWSNAERYGRNMINDFNNGMVGFTDWNILLDQTGGPNHVGNFCFAPIHANTETGELIYTPSYFYIGHFSKFIRPNAVRVSTTTSRSSLLSTSFMNEDGSIVSVVMNETNESINYTLYVGKEAVELEIPAHSMQSLIY